MKLVSELQRGVDFTRNNPAGTVWKEFSSARNKHPLIQFVKYGVCGGIATVVQQVVFIVLGFTILPHFNSVAIPLELSMDRIIINFALSSLIGFVASDIVCYALNIKFVFESGRHKDWIAFLLFTAFASIGFFAGLVMGIVARRTGVDSWGAAITLIVVSALVNYAFRKFFVFKG